MKRTLMFEDKELLDFEVEPEAGRARVLDAPGAPNGELASVGLDCSDLNAALTKLVRSRSISSNRADRDEILGGFGATSVTELVLMGLGASLTKSEGYKLSETDLEAVSGGGGWAGSGGSCDTYNPNTDRFGSRQDLDPALVPADFVNGVVDGGELN